MPLVFQDVQKNTQQLEAVLRRIIDHISHFPTLHDSSSGKSTAEEQIDAVFAILNEETRTLSQYFLSFSRALHEFWKEHLMLRMGHPWLQPHPTLLSLGHCKNSSLRWIIFLHLHSRGAVQHRMRLQVVHVSRLSLLLTPLQIGLFQRC